MQKKIVINGKYYGKLELSENDEVVRLKQSIEITNDIAHSLTK